MAKFDDIFLTMVCFANPRLRRSAIVVGKFAGLGSLTLVSTIAAAGSLVISAEWIALLGFVPLAPGLQALEMNRRARGTRDDGDGIEQLPSAFPAQVAAVPGVTPANGGDNLGDYRPVVMLNTFPPDPFSCWCLRR